MKPIIPPKYNIAFVVKHCNLQMLEALEPWCDRIYVNERFEVIGSIMCSLYTKLEHRKYIIRFIKKTCLTIEYNDPKLENDIVVEFDAKTSHTAII
jgi:hypothetical protein